MYKVTIINNGKNKEETSKLGERKKKGEKPRRNLVPKKI
jgi:hypothetical protein